MNSHAPVTSAEQWRTCELVIDGPASGNPFMDVEASATFQHDDSRLTVDAFYDGDGRHILRFLPPKPGEWTWTMTSNAQSLHGLTGRIAVQPSDAPGPVRTDGFHFRYASGGRYRPVGTTAYAWTHQSPELQSQTLETLSRSAFNKVRMCVFPKAYLYNNEDPELYPFLSDGHGGWDTTRFDPRFFRHFESQVEALGRLGIEADVILFHPYDRWGFADLGEQSDDRYVRYLVRRLAAYPNVWWSLANEYDLMSAKTIPDWERIASIVKAEDHSDHLTSIHNCFGFYDYSRPWITHCSIQRIDVYRTAENTNEWRERWGKPVVIDECAYEGDLDQGWGNITAEEMARRFWEGAVRGGYTGHGETYWSEDEVIWWSKGGRVRGASPDRIAFLDRLIGEAPGGVLEPLASEWDAPRGGVEGEYELVYFGFNRPRFRTLTLVPGLRAHVDVIDTWNMTVETLPGVHEGTLTVELPARQYMALRLRRAV
ncbi:MAG: DUF5605 domain-containing protein [Bifidobacteriaceae bacterium]|jgi:hypothetical protein|nr:DUF5605 domain-containing protein [Bifidobacteriaceae bacterium]